MRSETLTQIQPDPAAIHARWKELSEQQPGRFASEIAEELGVTESELMAARIGEGVTRLRPDWRSLLNALSRLGPVKTVTRNRRAVLEKKGVYPEFQHFDIHSVFASDDIDLRISLGFWGAAFAMATPGRHGDSMHRSIQFYGKDGAAVHKLFLTKDSHVNAFEDLLQEFLDSDQSRHQTVQPAFGARKTVSIQEIHQQELLEDWAQLQDTHSFFQLLQKHRATKADAFRLAEGRFTRHVSPVSMRQLITLASQQEIPLLVFLGNSGCVQIHKGLLKKTVDWKGWLNVMDPGVELHLSEEGVADAWVVKKPTVDGHVTSLELFDAHGRDVVAFFGIRTQEKKQEERWQQALAQLPSFNKAA